MWIVPLLALMAAPGEVPKSPPLDSLRTDSLRTDSLHPVADSTRPVKRSEPQPPPPPYRAPPWSWEMAPRVGALAVDFPQKANFASDLSQRVTSSSLVLRQPFPGSDLAWTAGLDAILRRSDAFRLVAGLDWSAWSAQAIAGKLDSLVHVAGQDSLTYRSYSSDLWTSELGFDILIPRRILSVDASRDAFLGFRYRLGVGRLVGKKTAWGWTSGESFLLGADVVSWKRWALSGMLGWNSTATSSDKNWSEILWDTPTPTKVSWDGGGLSLSVQLRWGPDRDTAAVSGTQKK